MTIVLLYLLIKKNTNLNISKTLYCFLTLIALLITSGATSQVTANFTTVDSTSACGSLVVEFQDLSTGAPNSWLWDLGNGNTSTLKNPIAIYSAAGVYDVKLTVTDGVVNDSKIELAYITVFENPTANIDIADTNTGCVSHFVEFLDVSQSSSTITSWFWNFGDGGNSNIQHPTYNYLSEGSFTVSLLVTDINSCQDLNILTDYIEIENKPIANFSADVLFSCSTTKSVSFYNLSSGNNLDYFWDFGDGATSTLANPTHNYSSGIFTVTLVADNGLCSDTFILQDYIEIGASTTTNFTLNTNSGCADLTVQFTDNSSSGVNNWYWDFGDGTTSTLQNPTHIYTVAGNYDVMLKTSIGGNCMSDTTFYAAVEVFDKPNILFNSSAMFICEAPFVVDFMDQTIGVTSWSWDFGNGITSNLQNPTVLYDTIGIYTVSLSVIDDNSCSNTLISANHITIDKLLSGFNATNLSGCTPFNTNFLDTSKSNQAIVSWYWDFGDGNTSSLQNPSHAYNTSGSYDIRLQIIDNLGCSSTTTTNNYIQVADPPQTDFIANPLVVCAGTNINFTDLSTTSTSIDAWLWSFGDGNSSAIQNPSHSYNSVGGYDVSLIASTIGCADTFNISNYIQVIEPTAFFTQTHNCTDPLKVDFTDLSSGADQLFWDFGDGSTSTFTHPVHTFPSRGTYNVMLSATNNTTGCTHDYMFPVRVTEPVANFTYLVNPNNGLEDSVGCRPHHVHLENLSQDMSHYRVLWEDGYVGYGRVDHLFDTIGTFDVTMIIWDIYSCKDTFTYQNMFSIKDVKADFEISNVTGCDSLLVEFNDLTIPNVTVLWDFGDGQTSTINQVQHAYYDEGVYDVTLFTESSYGCKDTMQKLQYIHFVYPIADFVVNKNTACFDEQINFLNHSSGMNLSYFWDFGDGITSTNQNNTHTYTQNGAYNISLSVIDSFGCTNYLHKPGYIQVQEPIADFSVNTVSSNCPPLISDFTNQSSNDASIFSWNFGDGTTSNIISPSHLYTSSGIYDVQLIVENGFGCKDTIMQSGLINISGPLGIFNISDNQICLDDTAIFTPIVSNTISYFWDFGDGAFSVDSQATHLYTNPGVYYPSLVLANSSACQFIVQSADSIIVSTVNIDAGSSVSICRNDSVALFAIADSGSVLWAPATFLSSPNTLNPFAKPTTTTVFTVSISNGVCEGIDSVLVVVNQEVPIPTINVNNKCVEDTLIFSANSGLSTNNISWLWDLGNGNQSILQNVNHQYAVSGNYLISLLVANLDNACETQVYKSIDIYETPVADFTADEVCLGTVTSFNDLSNSSDGEISQWFWQFGDTAGLSIQKDPKYQYGNHGTFTARLNVISDFGCENTITKNVIVNELPIADFTTIDACQNEYTLFHSTSSINVGNISNWNWSFGDGNTFSGDREVQHMYQNDGVFDVLLHIISDKGCEAKTTIETIVYPLPNPSFTTNYNCLGDYTAFYENATISYGSIISWNWDFGDGIATANHNNPNYQYLRAGTYPVSLTLLSDQLCENSITNNVTISPLPNVAIYVDDQTCLGEEIQLLDSSSVDGGYISKWNWNLGDGTTNTQHKVNHTYQSVGVYTVSLSVSSNFGCSSSKTFSNMINVFANPKSNFLVSNQFLSINNSTVEFFDQSVGAHSWNWNFGNGSNSEMKNPPSVTYYDTGKYIVSLLVSNIHGCSDTFYREVNIAPEFTFFIPNSFTPNGDGLDDDFLAYGEGVVSFRMNIYNRWGETIFTSFDKEFGWNGKDSFDNLIPNGIYLYHIAVSDLNGKAWVYNGKVNLIR